MPSRDPDRIIKLLQESSEDDTNHTEHAAADLDSGGAAGGLGAACR